MSSGQSFSRYTVSFQGFQHPVPEDKTWAIIMKPDWVYLWVVRRTQSFWWHDAQDSEGSEGSEYNGCGDEEDGGNEGEYDGDYEYGKHSEDRGFSD